jgi:hypothetical protein
MTDNGRRAYTVDDFLPICNLADNVIREQCNPFEVAESIVYVAKGLNGHFDMLNFKGDHEKKIEDAYNWAKSLDWKNVCKTWVKYFKEVY